MKRLIFSLSLTVLLTVMMPHSLHAAMSDYCSAPPYVTREIKANIMILLDNSCDMLNPAYNHTSDYSSLGQTGYFIPYAYYTYNQNRFQVVQQGLDSSSPYYQESYTAGGTTFSYVFKGDFLNYMIMSRYDFLQKILTGGNAAVPRQAGGASTVRSFSGASCAGAPTQWSWTDAGCVYYVDNGYLKIKDESVGSCSKLGIILAQAPPEKSAFFARLMDSIIVAIGRFKQAMLAALNRVQGFFAKVMEYFDVTRKAYAGGPYSVTIDTSTPLPKGSVSNPYSQTLTATAANGQSPYTYSWSIVVKTGESLPPGLSLSSGGVISGTPTAAGTHYFTVRVTVTDSRPKVTTADKQFSITITLNPLYTVTITDSTYPSGMVDVPYGSAYSTGPLSVTFNNSANTLTRGTGDFVQDGFISGSVITTNSANANNKGPFLVNSVTATTLIITTATGGDPTLMSGTESSVTVRDSFLQLNAAAAGGTPPYTFTWSICTYSLENPGCSAGNLPPGLSLSTAGYIYGVPSTTGAYEFTVQVFAKDANNANIGSSYKTFTISVQPYSETREASFRLWVDVGKDYFNIDLPATESTGILQKFWERARWGITDFDQVGNNVRIGVKECLGTSSNTAFLNAIDGTVPANVTKAPLSTAYWAIIRYYQNQSQNTTPGWQGGCIDPFSGDTVQCRKNFVLTISSAYDVSGSDDTQFDQTGCNYVEGASYSGKRLVKNACYAYKTDLRDSTHGASDVPGMQNLYHYTVFTLAQNTEAAIDDTGTTVPGGRGTNKTILKQAAELTGTSTNFKDASNPLDVQNQIVNAINDILSQAASGTAVSVLTTSSRGIGSMVQAYFLPKKQEGLRSVMWTGYLQNLWIDPQDNLREDTTNDFMLKMDLVNATDGDKVVRLFFDDTSGSTKAATFTTDANGSGGTLSSCTPTVKDFTEVNYLWEAGKKLALQRPLTRTIFTSKKVMRGSAAPGTTVTTTVLDTTSNPKSPLFDGSMSAALKSALTVTATDPYTENDIIEYVKGVCKETLDASNQPITGDTPCSNTTGTTYRDRRLTVNGGDTYGNVWKLGDIISSTPKVFGNTPLNTYHIDYNDTTYLNYVSSTGNGSPTNYKNRSSIVFVGANDGMLHAFNVGYLKDTGLDASIKALFKDDWDSADDAHDTLGTEVWAYIPYNAFPYLKYLASPDYCHIPYNDLTPRVIDVSLGCPNDASCDQPGQTRVQDASKSSWRTVLIGGMRFGGACGTGGTPADPPGVGVGYSAFYALDVTDPENPVPMWEFSDDDLGYATSYPSVVRTGGKLLNGNWYVVFGSGSKQIAQSGMDIARTATGYIYVLDLKTGTLVKKMSLDHAGIVGDVLAIDADKDYVSEKLYFGTAYKDTTWKGKLVAIDVPALLATSGVEVSWSSTFGNVLFSDNYPLTASPDSAKDADGNIWVFAGSGKYYTDVDETDTSQQIFLGLKDKSDGSITYPLTILSGNLDNRTTTATEGTVTGTTTMCLYDKNLTPTPGFHNMTVVTSIDLTSAAVSASTKGWYLNLFTSPTSERVISRPLAVGGLVDFLTYMPSADVCKYGGDSYLYAVGYTTGVAPPNVAIRSPGITSGITEGTVTVKKGMLLGPGAPPMGEAIIIPPQKVGQEQLKKKIQIATGVIVEAENKPAISTAAKIIHWLKK